MTKPVLVADLRPDQTFTSYFLVCEKEIRATREGKAYLRMELGDRTGTIEARMWDGFEPYASAFERDDFVKVQARVESYRNRLQISLEKVRRAEEQEIDVSDFFPHTTQDVEQLYGKLCEYASLVGNPWLRRLVESVVRDPELVPRLKRAPAAKVMHHAYLGGLLEHMVSLCGLCRVVAAHYPETDLDLLMTGAIVHDIGKVDELSYDRSFGYTDDGQLLGHIEIEYERVAKKIDAIEGFPSDLKTLVLHMIISHHGQYAFGSPKLPMFREALMLHFLDDLDSKMAAVRSALSPGKGEGNWTAWSAALERRFLRVDLFRRMDEAEAKNASATPPEDALRSPGGEE
jgi:3'-5' exoribonuclease